MTPAPPGRLSGFAEPHRLAAGTTLERVFNRAGGRAAIDFNPCRGDAMRFSPLFVADGAGGRRCVPTLYAASRLATAAFESVFRDRPADGRPWPVRENRLAGLAQARLVLRHELRLAPLFVPELAAWGLTRAQLIDSPAASYGWTVRWAAAIHEQFPGLQGLAWASRRDDGGQAYLLFGDRVPADLFELVLDRPLDRGPGLAEIQRVAARSNIVLVR